jgi:hypothetical protein
LKRIAAILLLALFLFNWFGYRLLSDYMQQRADSKLEARLDQNDYDESRLIKVTMPLNMPYQNNWSDYERYDGEVEIDGVHYKYVKRKIENGQLVLLCLPNDTKMQLQSAKNDFFKLVNDLQNSSQNKSSDAGHSIKSPVTEYWQQQSNWQIEALAEQPAQYALGITVLPVTPYTSAPVQPPDA